MKIGIASDHRGYALKNKIIKYLEKKKHNTLDYGTNSLDKVDFVDYAVKIGEAINKNEIELGILICGTGIGMSIAANKIKGIMCAKTDNAEEAYYAKRHNNVNVISINSRKNILIVKDILDKFLETEFEEEENYIRRINKIQEIEKSSKN